MSYFLLHLLILENVIVFNQFLYADQISGNEMSS